MEQFEIEFFESERLEDGIFELRTIMGNNIARVLYFL